MGRSRRRPPGAGEQRGDPGPAVRAQRNLRGHRRELRGAGHRPRGGGLRLLPVLQRDPRRLGLIFRQGVQP
ncbi:hypothetical protein OF001_U240020 [Pseudomonas sp. OF001]|nr:hypothetical protein OF001_U240020 [Pseudomonas sp. OF001]